MAHKALVDCDLVAARQAGGRWWRRQELNNSIALA